MNMISNGELSDPLCDSINRGLTLVRLSEVAYNEMTLITKHLGIPGKHSIYFFINFTLTAKLHITKSRLNELILKPLRIKDHTF